MDSESKVTNDLRAVQRGKEIRMQLSLRSGGTEDAIMFRSYRYLRNAYPEVEPFDWQPRFGDITAKLELRYYLERVSATGSVFATVRDGGVA